MKKNMVAGFNLSCVGDNNDFSIVESKYGNTLADKVLKTILKLHTKNRYSNYSYLERGSDERQYNSPGVDLPVVCFCRSKFCEFDAYHTSAVYVEFVREEGFGGGYEIVAKVIRMLERNSYYKMKILCEPQLGKRGLYPTVSRKGNVNLVKNMMNFIAYADGKNDLIDISSRIECEIDELIEIINNLKENDLIDEV